MDASLLRLKALYSRQNSVVGSCWTFKLGYFVHAQRAITVEQCKMFDHKQNKPQTNSVVQCDSHSHTSPAVLYTLNECPLKRCCHQISLCHVLPAFHSDAGSWQTRSPMLLLAAMAPWSSVYAQWMSLKMCCHQKCCCHRRSPIPATSRQQSRCLSDLHIPRKVCCLGPQDTAMSHQQLYTHGEYPLRWLSNQICCYRFYAHKWISTEMALQSEIICCFFSPVLCTQLNVHWNGFWIRNRLLQSHQFYGHKWMSTEMALQSEIIRCCLISFMHPSESPPRWRCNHKLSVATWSVLCNFISFSSPLCTQVNAHWDGVAIKDHPLLPRLTSKVFCIQSMSTEMLWLSSITNHSHVTEKSTIHFCSPWTTLKTALALEFNCCHLTLTTHPAECM